MDVMRDSQVIFSAVVLPAAAEAVVGPAGAGEGFCQTNLGFSNRGLGLGLALAPKPSWPWLLGWGRGKETSKFKISEEETLNQIHILNSI